MTRANVAKRATSCPLDCPDACSLEVTVTDGRVTAVAGTAVNSLTDGYICTKVRRFPEHQYGEARLRHPLIRDGRRGAAAFRRASWDEALDRVAENLVSVRDAFGGEAILPLSYGGSNGFISQDTTDARLFRRLGASRLLRTVCAAATTRAATGLYGKMVGVAMSDYVHAELIVVWGANPHASGMHHVPSILKAQRAGAKLVVIDPRATPLARLADLHLAVRPGTDLPVALAVIRELFARGAADVAFLSRHATGVEALRERAEPWRIARAATTADVAPDAIATLVDWYATSAPAVVRCGWGVERNRNGGSAVAAILALPAVAGKFGVRGGGYTMSNSGGWNLSSDAAVRAEVPPSRAVNMNRVGQALLATDEPRIRHLFVYNANPLMTLPAQGLVRRGLEREDLFTVVFDQVMTDTARYADVVLPATTFLEHEELRRSYGAIVLQNGQPVVDPVGESRPNVAVFAELVARCGLARPGDPVTSRDVRDAILAAAPDGTRYRAELEAGGVAHQATGAHPIQFVDVLPLTADGRIHLCPADLDREAPRGLYVYQPDPGSEAHPLALISPATARTTSSTFGQLVQRLVPAVLHPDDAAARGIADGDPIRVFNDQGEVRVPAQVDRRMRPGVVELPKGLWSHNTANGETANALAPDSLTDLGAGACFNDARVEVERLGDGDGPDRASGR